VKAVILLRKAGYDVELNLYGYALDALREYIASIDALIEAAGLGTHVRRHGFVDNPRRIARENEIVLSASTDESMPQGLLFQMYQGLIGVAVLSGGIDEVVTDGCNGYLIQDPTPPSIAAALVRCIEDRYRWCEVAAEARCTIADQCSASHTTGQLLDFLGECVVLHGPVIPVEVQPVAHIEAIDAGLTQRPTSPTIGEVAIPQSLTASWRKEEGRLVLRAAADAMCGVNLLFESSRSLVATLAAAVRPDLGLRCVTAEADADGIVRLRWPPVVNGFGQSFVLRLKIIPAGTGSFVRPRIRLREVVYAASGSVPL
jgi:hypothetical protein